MGADRVPRTDLLVGDRVQDEHHGVDPVRAEARAVARVLVVVVEVLQDRRQAVQLVLALVQTARHLWNAVVALPRAAWAWGVFIALIRSRAGRRARARVGENAGARAEG